MKGEKYVSLSGEIKSYIYNLYQIPFMKKRGVLDKRGDINEYLLFTIGEVVFVVLIFWALLSYVDSIEEDTLIEKNYLARDLALIIDTIYAAPGNLYYFYSFEKINLTKFTFGFNKQRAIVVEKEGSQQIKFPYADDLILGNRLNIGDIQVETLELVKTDNIIDAGENLEADLKKIICPTLTVSKPGTVEILINPENNYEEEARITLRIAETFAAFSGEKGFDFKLIEQELTEEQKQEIIKDESPDIFISIRIGNYSDNEKNNAKAFTGKDRKSLKLGCTIVNSLSGEYADITGTSIIPSEEDIVKIKEVSLILELGNIEAEKSLARVRKEKLVETIINGINDYYD